MKIINYELHKTIIKPKLRLTYEEADELIELAPSEDIEISLLENLLRKRQDYRIKNGAITLDQDEGRFYIKNERSAMKIISNTIPK